MTPGVTASQQITAIFVAWIQRKLQRFNVPAVEEIMLANALFYVMLQAFYRRASRRREETHFLFDIRPNTARFIVA